MNTLYQETMLLKTCVELDAKISSISHMIRADRYIEVGDDPNLLHRIEKVLMDVYNKAKSIEPYFDLNRISLRRANYYFDLIMQVDETLSYLQEIRRKDYGSRQHTCELLEKLQNCSNSIFAMSDLVNMNTEVVH
jgi:hypothetical protein